MKIINRLDVSDHSALFNAISQNALNRNVHLNNLMNLFNRTQEPIVIGIDGAWGTGKSVFLKQLDYLINEPIASESVLNVFNDLVYLREHANSLYFNSWENDIYENPLLALLLNLLNIKEEKLGVEKYNKEAFFKVIEVVANVATKATTGGALGIADVKSGKSEMAQLLESVTTVDKIREEIYSLLDTLTEKKDLIIIIDELDRCKPTFAVELLEVVKHYFMHKKIKFILCSNKSELSHTIRNYYGQGFNGYEYLDRFIDFEYILPAPNSVQYFENFLEVSRRVHMRLAIEIIEYFDLSLRQVNKFVLYAEMLSHSHDERVRNGKQELLIFTYYLAALKIVDISKYNSFLRGDGEAYFTKFFSKAFGRISGLLREITEAEAIQSIQEEYNSIFNIKKEADYIDKKYDEFIKVFSYIK